MSCSKLKLITGDSDFIFLTINQTNNDYGNSVKPNLTSTAHVTDERNFQKNLRTPNRNPLRK